jgi:hypothetical protein
MAARIVEISRRKLELGQSCQDRAAASSRGFRFEEDRPLFAGRLPRGDPGQSQPRGRRTRIERERGPKLLAGFARSSGLCVQVAGAGVQKVEARVQGHGFANGFQPRVRFARGHFGFGQTG